MPIKLFTDGEILDAAEVNTYFMDQALCVFTDATERDAAFGGTDGLGNPNEPALAEGRICYLKSDRTIYIYTKTSTDPAPETFAWVAQLATIEDNAVTESTIAAGAVTETKIGASAVTAAKIATAVAGNGLAGGGGTALSVNVDGSTLEISSDSLRVKDLGITSGKLATSLSLTTPTLGVASATSINKVALTAPATSATLTLANGSTLATSGAFSTTLTATATTSVILPTTGTLATLAGVEQLTNKTLVAPVITGAIFNDGSIVFEGATANDFETTLQVVDPTADNTITLQNASGTVALLGTIALGTDTTGNYMSGVTSGTGVTVSHTPGEGSSATVSIGQAVASTDSPTFAGVTVRAASTQDSVILQGRSGGTSSYSATLTPTTLTASRIFTLPNVSGTVITTGDTATITNTMLSYTTIPQQTVSTSAPSGGKQNDIWIKVA